ncbi:MAG TPA: carboxypeptidase regulatory-like domain-containing protein, partial [Terriglobales bacterium]|nr:carboxypeptidase regulatory-like domain-containing protein [Terriglobales bacterium]
LNDVLKSLTAVDLGDGRISSVRYNSIAPLDERLKSLRLPFGEQVTRAGFLQAMRGARVEVHNGASSAVGRLLSVESSRRQDAKGNFMDVTEFSVMTDNGEMKNFELSPATSVRIADRELNDEVGRYLGLIGSSRARDVRRMMMTATGSGDREVFVSYISEVPIWKSTYRIIFPEKAGEKPLLQGWAIVDNTIGEDWKDVQLSLIAGAPQSFVQNISQPFYTRRPVIALPASVMLTPQSHEATLERYDRLQKAEGQGAGVAAGSGGGTVGGIFRAGPVLTSLQGTVKDPAGAIIPRAQVTVRNEETGASQVTTTDASGHYSFSNVQAGNSALFVSSPGFKRYELSNFYLGVGRTNEIDATLEVGSATETVEVQAAASATLETQSASLVGMAGKQTAEAEGKSAGDFFEYNLKQKISVARNQSALVPILQNHIEAEKVTLWNEESPPLRAIWIKNTSGQVLDAGTFNVLEADAFAGEGVLENIHPDERRLLSYAADSAVHVKYEDESNGENQYTRIKIAKGIMVLTQEQRAKKKYTIRNADTEARQVIVEYPAQEGWELTKDTPKPEESSASFHRFRVAVESGKSSELTVESFHPEQTTYELTNLDSDEVELLVKQKRVTPVMQEAFDRILAQKNKIGDLDLQINQHKQESDQITADQNRIRENMKALKGSSEERSLLQRYAKQLDSQ